MIPDDAICITCCRTNDGPGALANSQASVLLFARSQGLTYLHQPMRGVGHNDRGAPDWDEGWDRFFAIGHGEVPLSEVRRPASRTISIPDPTNATLIPGTTYEAVSCHRFSSTVPDRYNLVRRALREKFCLANGLPVDLPRGDVLSVVVHVRRGDVTPSLVQRYTPTELVARHLAKVIEAVEACGLECSVRAYSEDEPENLTPLSDLGAELHLRESPREAYEAMVQADVLLTARSSFSRLAGLIGRGIVLHEANYTAAPSDWIVLTEDNLLNLPRLMRSKICAEKP